MKPRCKKLLLVNLEDGKQKMVKIPTNLTRKLSEELRNTKHIICRTFHNLQKTYKNAREISHELTIQQANHKVRICRSLLKKSQDYQFFKRMWWRIGISTKPRKSKTIVQRGPCSLIYFNIWLVWNEIHD